MLTQCSPKLKNRPHTPTTINSQNCSVLVKFIDELSTSEVVTAISSLSRPQVVLWYIGPTGLKKAGVEFYRDSLVSPLLNNNSETTFWLVDLTAWSAFRNVRGSIQNASSCCIAIQKFSSRKIRCIKASDIFKKMQTIREQELLEYFEKALDRGFIRKASVNFPKRNILTREIFSSDCPLMTHWYDQDVGKSYSVFQYLEGCLLCEEIFLKLYQEEARRTTEIVFALPNDELKYYHDNENSFQKDVEFLINKRCEELGISGISLNISFFAFKYGSKSEYRPYNAPGKVLKQNSLFYEDIVGKYSVFSKEES